MSTRYERDKGPDHYPYPEQKSQDEQLRELLSYLQTQFECAGDEGSLMSYGDAANRLRVILDGEL